MPPCLLEALQNSRGRLIEAAIFCFSEHGFDATGIREIAKRAKANSALVQYHFGGKEGLYNAALQFIFDRNPPAITHHPPAAPDAPGAKEQAALAIRDLIQHLVSELLTCKGDDPLEMAALLLVTREMQAPHPKAIPLVLAHVRPIMEHLEACLRALRPGLSPARVMDLEASIIGPIFHLHSNTALIRILRDDPGYPTGPGQLTELVDHLTEFSLRGLGLPEAFPQQGA